MRLSHKECWGKDGERVSLQFSLFLSAMGPLFTLLLTAALSTSLPSLSSVFFHPIFQPVMNRLSLFNGVHPGLSRLEFTELLRVYPTDSLKSLRADLFVEVCNLGLVPNELLGIPLVDRRDSALRPISNVLSNDVWTIAQSISNNVPIPRTILKNGKRSHKFLQSQISNQHSATTQSTEEAEEAATVEPTTTHSSPTASSSELQTSPNASSSQPQTSLTSFAFQPPPRMPATSLQSRENSDCSTLPSRSNVTDLLISRDISAMKDDIRQLKSELSSLRNLPPVNSQSEYRVEIGRELSKLRSEVTLLRGKLASLSSPASQEPEPPPSNPTNRGQQTTSDRIKIAAWNCRGVANAHPYLNQLISNGSDVIILSEHWLWPFQLNQLQDIHPSYAGFGFADKRLNEKSHLTKGCGGVGIIWRKSLPIIPMTKIVSDRFCAVQLQPENPAENVYIIGVYLPSCNHSMEDFAEYLADLENTISTLQPTGRIILAGDLNVHLTQSNQSSSRESLLHHCIHRHNLYSVSTSTNNVSGPNYTFFSSTSHSTVDYILTESSLVGQVTSCQVHEHHPLNLSDHLPVSMVIMLHTSVPPPPAKTVKPINWSKAVENGDFLLNKCLR